MTSATPPLLLAEGIVKRFGANEVLSGVTVRAKNPIMALLAPM